MWDVGILRNVIECITRLVEVQNDSCFSTHLAAIIPDRFRYVYIRVYSFPRRFSSHESKEKERYIYNSADSTLVVRPA
jgi:hypothetical protein